MKITCTQQNLHRALSMVGRIVGNKVSLPVLGNILLQTEKGRIKISATDLEIGLTTRIGAKVDTEGSITVPARTLTEFVTSVADDNLTLSTKDLTLSVVSDQSKATLRGIDAEEFPVIPSVDSKSVITVHGPTFEQAIKQVIIATATDDTRPVLAGVLLKWSGKTLKLAATDSYRLAEKVITLDEAVASDQEAIVPARCLAELTRILGLVNPHQVLISLQENQILFSFEETELVSRLIDGKYPDYEKIIPTAKTTTAIIDAETFKSTLKAAGIFAREASNTIKMHFGPEKKVAVTAVADQVGDVDLAMPAEIDGEEAEASFNVKYLLDATTGVSDDKIEFSLSGQYQPGLICGTKSTDYRYVIMPLRTD